ncbi:hypothetical protein BABINDRAFT_163530 [Babjeviella inositovora NRRL Y-12698]|uniref:PQ-loop repeat-containing protein 1 n=1 Tax=Babjeviella inositovora NRRL Y-12698 TaxID=984486 RepID=A0A1E3QIQ3_9ASCO|nr:uncharacterized protein BABINDRAFT_163530 [Babjeviella inositovora NRRL Y-12698]ODQ77530.1 hypothetical protein BABINDRAFT_163530 [Babjeviella inositovora NRRL Y-12698]
MYSLSSYFDIPVGYWEYLPDTHKLVNLYMMLTPFFSYGSTVYSIHTKQSSTGFSMEICATMLMAATLRICYYFVNPYEVTLFRQSCSMVAIQCLLLKVSLHYRRPVSAYSDDLAARNSWLQELMNAKDRFYASSSSLAGSLFDHICLYIRYYSLIAWHFGCYIVRFFDVYYRRPFRFWQWQHERPYWRFIGSFAALFIVLTYCFSGYQAYGECIGMVGLLVESLLPLPQILLLQRLQSVENFKVILLVSWLCGDVLKLSYLFWGTDNVAGIFVVFALFQMGLDFIIAGQWWYYREKARMNSSSSSEHEIEYKFSV